MMQRFLSWLPDGLRHPVLLIFALIMAAVGAGTYAILVDSQRRIIEHEALRIAEVVALQALAARTAYTTEVADKLRKDGFGAHIDSAGQPGHVPLPAQFLKLVGREATASGGGLYSYRPLSKWNLEPTQGLRDEFQRWAWDMLEAQDGAAPAGPIAWQPAWRIERLEGIKTLRYMHADPAAAGSCVACHNEMERDAQVLARRVSASIPVGKQWRQHQLLGAIEVTVPIERVEQLAAAQEQTTIFLVLALSVLGLAIAAIYAYQDIRRKQALAERFERMNETLEERVAERTQELRLAVRELEAFSYSVSHDLRSPLGVISGFSHILSQDESSRLSEEGRRKLGLIETNIAYMVDLVDDMLALAGVNRAPLVRIPLNMRSIAGLVVEQLQVRYPAVAVQVNELPGTEGDETLVRQALTNLVDNAFKYSSRAAAPRVELGWDPAMEAYYVRDNGIGFDMAHSSRLFNAFERLHPGPEYPGTGIGLAIVKHVAERHGGRVWAVSAAGSGATFWIQLPRAAVPASVRA
jgi:signal transduction histidine kinase